MKDSWKRPINQEKQIDYPTQPDFVFGPRDATPEEVAEWQEKELNWWAEKQLLAVAVASIIQFSALAFMLSMFLVISQFAKADDNHVHIDQVNTGDDTSLTVTQKGYGNEVEFSFDHQSNTFNLQQYGSNNKISWVPYWGSGYSWGGDIDGVSNTLNIEQHDGATWGGHVWGNSNQVDVYQNGTHTHYLDIHSDYVDHDVLQEGGGSHYAHIWYYGSADGSNTNVQQKGNGNHNASITLQGSQPTVLNLLQDSAISKSYTLTQTCVTVGGCNITVTQQ